MKEITKVEFHKLDPLGKIYHPDGVLLELLELIQKIGANKFLHGAGYNKERDSFLSVLFSYAVRKWSKREWFLQQIDDPPDFFMISPSNRKIMEKPMDRLGVEIVEIQSEDPAEAIETIKNTKLNNYKPGFGTALLVFLNNKNATGVGLQLSLWAVKNKENFSNFSELYFLYIESFSPATTWTYQVVNVFKPWNQRCVLSEEYKKGILFPHPLIERNQLRIID